MKWSRIMNWLGCVAKKRSNKRVRPVLEGCEARNLLSLAVIDLVNQSTFNMTIGFRWGTNSSFSYYSLSPGSSREFWTTASSSLYPQVQYNSTVGSSLTLTTNLNAYGGYNIYSGAGTPPVSAAKVYDFVNQGKGVAFTTPPPPQAVIDLVNQSSFTMTIGFRWGTNSSFSYYTMAPGSSREFWTTASSSLYPQVAYANGGGLTLTTNLNALRGYNIYTGAGTPPVSAAKVYDFVNHYGSKTTVALA